MTDSEQGMRLNQYLALCGLGSRRGVEGLITSGRVRVNGEVATDLGRRVTSADSVEFEGQGVVAPKRLEYLALNKPAGYLCARHDPEGRQTIYDLLPEHYGHLHHIGRLDQFSRGLLLLSNDGEFTNRLLHPRGGIQRVYHVKTRLALTESEREQLLEGVEIGEDEVGRALEVRLDRNWAEIVLAEGRNREIRRMLDAMGQSVLDLVRVSFGGLELADLPEGKFRTLSKSEVDWLADASNAP